MKNEWIKSTLKQQGKTAKGLAEALGLPHTRVSEMIHGKRDIQITEVATMSRYLETSIDSILKQAGYGSGFSPSYAGNDFREHETGNTNASPPNGLQVVEIDIRAGMGGGGIGSEIAVTDENGNSFIADDVRGTWTIPSEFLRSELHVNASQARIIEVMGDSMLPTLSSGDRIMVDLNNKRPSPPGIFALWDGFGVVVKRLEHISNSDPATFHIKSDNPLHESYERTIDEINIIGRVVWYGRRL